VAAALLQNAGHGWSLSTAHDQTEGASPSSPLLRLDDLHDAKAVAGQLGILITC
jgi:hypothetical protein